MVVICLIKITVKTNQVKEERTLLEPDVIYICVCVCTYTETKPQQDGDGNWLGWVRNGGT